MQADQRQQLAAELRAALDGAEACLRGPHEHPYARALGKLEGIVGLVVERLEREVRHAS